MSSVSPIAVQYWQHQVVKRSHKLAAVDSQLEQEEDVVERARLLHRRLRLERAVFDARRTLTDLQFKQARPRNER